MIKTLRDITGAMADILADPKASRLERIEAARIAASCQGVMVPSPLDRAFPTKTAVELAMTRQTIRDKLFGQKERRSRKNKRNYLRRKIKELEAGGPSERLEKLKAELYAMECKVEQRTQEQDGALTLEQEAAKKISEFLTQLDKKSEGSYA